ncbi:MAG: phospholipase [Deltaproteobacteria bacterium]|nr:MAG: phospholipase [Deltaproteobacteria bacterium]
MYETAFAEYARKQPGCRLRKGLAMNLKMQFCLLLLLAGFFTLPAAAATSWLIAAPDEFADAGAPVLFYVVKPDGHSDWPDTLRLRMVQDNRTYEVELTAVEAATPDSVRRSYRAVLSKSLSGLVRVDLAGVESNRLVLQVTASDEIKENQTDEIKAKQTEKIPETKPGRRDSVLFPAGEPALSVNEPMYFVAGGTSGGLNDATARFQFSLKYRILDPDSLPVQWCHPLSGLNFAYTQTSLWDLGEESAPFHDTSYRPSLFWQGAASGKGLMPDMLRGGYEHESNGKDGADSRGIDMFFMQPVWEIGFPDGRRLIFGPKIYGYLNKSGHNSDIQKYRGNVDWIFRYGREDGLILASLFRIGTTGRGSAQFDLSYPLRRSFFARTGGFLYLQVFKGYGESLLDYKHNSGTQVRVGFAFVR